MASFPLPQCVEVRAPSGVVVEEIETLPMSLTLKLKVGKHRQRANRGVVRPNGERQGSCILH